MCDRVLLTIPSLRGGGAERVFALISSGLSALGLDVHLAVAQCEGPWLKTLPDSVAVHDLKAPQVRYAAWPLWRLVRRLRPDCVISTLPHMNTLVGLTRIAFPSQTRVLLRESTSLAFTTGLPGSNISAVQRSAYRAADGVICLSEGMRQAFQDQFGIAPQKLTRIYNPMSEAGRDTAGSAPASDMSPLPPGPGPHLLSIGRMDASKGFDRLIAAFPQCLRRHPMATLTILGDGPDRHALELQAHSLGLADRIRMPGFQAAVNRWLRAADLFVLASRFEGLPNVLLEAIDAECPVAVLDHPGGTREILELLGQGDRITNDLSEWRERWFQRPDSSVRTTALQHFGTEAIIRQYADVVRNRGRMSRAAA